MAVLDRKSRRDLKRLWPQIAAIALVMATGVATLVIGVGAQRSLFETREAYYERQRFADVFASATRAPQHLLDRIREIEGVAAAEARVAGRALIDVEGMVEPVTGRVLSLPVGREPAVNAILIRDGRVADPAHGGEVVVNAAFADAHGLQPGDRIRATLHGTKRELSIAGIAHSPEFIYALGTGDLMPDNRRFAVVWMPEPMAAAAYGLEGAFNDVSLTLQRSASEAEVIDRLDRLLDRYGGTGAYAREHQVSHAFIEAEMTELAAMSRVLPPIFLGVGAFLVNMTLGRLIALEREQIGLLKALGYPNRAIVWHYFRFALAISLIGLVVGCLGGLVLGRGLTRLYAEFFNFPFLHFTRSIEVYVLAILVSLASALAGAGFAVLRAARLAPAVAMAPPAPPSFRRPWIEQAGLMPRLSQLSMLVFRHLLRWPVRSGLTSLGIAMPVALLVATLFATDSIDLMVDVSFFRADRQDATVTFTDIKPLKAVEEAKHLPGVLRAEPVREVPVRLRHGHRSRRTALVGRPAGADLNRVIDLDFAPVVLPREGLVVAEKLAELIGAEAGDRVIVDILDGRGRSIEVPLREVIKTYLGTLAYMDLDALNRLVGDAPVATGVNFTFDPRDRERMFAEIKDLPGAAAISLRRQSLKSFRETLAETLDIMITVYLVFAGTIAFGVVYNSARVRLSERARELASLRVLGFTRSEIYWVMFAEFAILTMLAIPLGWVLGAGLTYALVKGLESELFQIPFVIEPPTFAGAALVVLAAAAISAEVVRRRIAKLDLVAVLKTRE